MISDVVTAAVAASDTVSYPRAIALAQQLHLPLAADFYAPTRRHRGHDTAFASFDFLLVVSDRCLSLIQRGSGKPEAIVVDFVTGTLGYRQQHGGGIRQLLGRAVGIKPGWRPQLLDATAGLGRDGYILATLGCQVVLIERHPIIVALLQDGLARALRSPASSTIVSQQLQLRIGDAVEVMAGVEEGQYPDVVYLDPMFPHAEERALIKKEMRLLRHLTGGDHDTAALLDAALRCAKSRVVVKRPLQGAVLTERSPTLTMRGKSIRYDIYLV